MKITDLNIKDRDGNEVSMATYQGKVLLIVNTATECGFTPQYNELQELYQKYEEQGLVVLDFPCDQFKNQAPGTNAEIHEACVRRFKITFPQFAKIDVNGPGADPLFTNLKSEKKGLFKDDIKWNFTKFLVDREGEVVARFAPQTTPMSSEIVKQIEKCLARG